MAGVLHLCMLLKNAHLLLGRLIFSEAWQKSLLIRRNATLRIACLTGR